MYSQVTARRGSIAWLPELDAHSLVDVRGDTGSQDVSVSAKKTARPTSPTAPSKAPSRRPSKPSATPTSRPTARPTELDSDFVDCVA